jgi:hypothetical protein
MFNIQTIIRQGKSFCYTIMHFRARLIPFLCIAASSTAADVILATLLIIPHVFRDIQSSETGQLETYIIIYDNRDVFSVSEIERNNQR